MVGGKKSIFWGIVLLLLAVALLARRLGYLEGIGFWPILFSAVLVMFLVKGIVRGNFGTILFSLAFLVIVNDELLHLEAITPWPVLGAALLGTMGLKMLFPGFGHRWQRYFYRDGRSDMIAQEDRNGGWISYENVFGTIVKYVSDDVEHVDMENVFGSLTVYFMDARLPGGFLNIDVDSVFGSIALYIPSSWKVAVNMERVFSNTRENGKCDWDGMHTVYISGDIVFGELKILYV